MLDDQRLRDLAADLCTITGVRAAVLGGSRARGMHRPDSDFDLGVYYDGYLDLVAVQRLADRWADEPSPVAPPGDWGPWVDGGAWLTIDGVAVDWILRDIRRVAKQCERARRGEFEFHHQPGHPLGFLDIAYAGEVATCVRLSDDDLIISELAARVTPYPEALRSAMVSNLWQLDFLLDGAEKGAKSVDVAYVTLCLTTAAMLTAHAWHASAGQWVTNEKSLVPGVARLPIDTGDFSGAVASILGSRMETSTDLQRAIGQMREVPRPSVGGAA